MKRTNIAQETATHFLNVDVDVMSRVPLEAIVAALGRRALVHYVGREGRGYSAHFSLISPRSADAAIRRLAGIIGRLPAPARRLWRQATARVFNVGFEAGFHPHSFEAAISAAALEAAARLGASLTVTIYAARIESGIRPAETRLRRAPKVR